MKETESTVKESLTVQGTPISGLDDSPCSVQWWVADIDRHGNPTLSDGAHSDREGCEEALYIMARLGLRPDQKRAICRVEIYPPEAKAHDTNEDALRTLNGIGLGQNSQDRSPGQV